MIVTIMVMDYNYDDNGDDYDDDDDGDWCNW